MMISDGGERVWIEICTNYEQMVISDGGESFWMEIRTFYEHTGGK
jgi:hypothetical protein